MKHLTRFIGLTVLNIFLLSASYLSAATEDAKVSIEAKKVVEDYFKALNEGKLDIIVGLYHKDSVFLPKNAPAVRGIDEITKAYRTLFEKIKLNTEHVYHHVSVHGDIAIVESQANGTLTLLEGKKLVPANDKELFVLRKINNKWKIDRYMFNDSENSGG
ncbi:MAG: nuclear transport factor 2 family protein [Candidatus Manganitrophaceae bacterium]